MPDDLPWRPLYRVLAPEDIHRTATGRSLVEVRSLDRTTVIDANGVAPGQVLAVVGDLCAYSTGILEPVLVEVSNEAPHLVLDLGGVTFIDASAVTMLLAVRRHVTEQGGSLVLDPISTCVGRLLRVAGVDELLGIAVPTLATTVGP